MKLLTIRNYKRIKAEEICIVSHSENDMKNVLYSGNNNFFKNDVLTIQFPTNDTGDFRLILKDKFYKIFFEEG